MPYFSFLCSKPFSVSERVNWAFTLLYDIFFSLCFEKKQLRMKERGDFVNDNTRNVEREKYRYLKN